jgi:hypothetical protein
MQGSAGDTVACIQLWYHRLPFAVRKRHENNPDAAIATPCSTDVFAFVGIPADHRFFVDLSGEDPRYTDGGNEGTSSSLA